MKVVFVTLLFALQSALALNILGIYPHQGKSHFLVFRVLLRELASRGHNVTVISHFPEAAPPKNYHDIDITDKNVLAAEEKPPPLVSQYLLVTLSAWILAKWGTENCELMLKNQQVRNLVDSNQKFDVVLVEQFNSDCALGLAYKLNAPVVGTTSHALMPYHYERFGVPNNPAYVSFHFFGGGTKPTLYQRIERTVFDFYYRKAFYWLSQRRDQNVLAKYYDDVPPLEELAREMKFLLLYNNFILTGSKLMPANIIEVGGYHVAKAKPLTGGLKKFVDEAKHGVIYISFGSFLKSSSLPIEKINAISDAVKELPQRVIWKWEDKTVSFEKDKFYIDSWLPQVDILGHPNTIAFISHGGMGGTTEAITYGVPMIAMPLFGDQPSNSAAVEEIGFGVVLEHKDLTKENLLAALKKVLEPQFLNHAKSLSKAWHDRPSPPIDTAVFWTEFAARHSNHTFRAAAADTPYYKAQNLDIFILAHILVYAIYRLAKYLYYRRKNQSSNINAKTKKKSKKDN